MIAAQTWREMADDLATIVSELTSGPIPDKEWAEIRETLREYNRLVKEDDDVE